MSICFIIFLLGETASLGEVKYIRNVPCFLLVIAIGRRTITSALPCHSRTVSFWDRNFRSFRYTAEYIARHFSRYSILGVRLLCT